MSRDWQCFGLLSVSPNFPNSPWCLRLLCARQSATRCKRRASLYLFSLSLSLSALTLPAAFTTLVSLALSVSPSLSLFLRPFPPQSPVHSCPQGAFVLSVLWRCIAQLRYRLIDADWHSKCVFAPIASPPSHWPGVSRKVKGAWLRAARKGKTLPAAVVGYA